MGRHILEVAGSKVTIVDGDIMDITEPKTLSCPLRRTVYGIEKETVNSVRRTVEFYINDWGMFTEKRIVSTDQMPINFGVTEMLASALTHDIIDAVVMVCEGAGTVVSSLPQVVEGIGAHMTGLVETSKEPGIIRKLRSHEVLVLDPEHATMDPIKGLRMGLEEGYKRIAVTITGHEAINTIKLKKEGGRDDCAVIAVHNTGIERNQACILARNCDIVTSCASRWVREEIGPLASMQLGMRIPVFILTDLGKDIALVRLRDFSQPLIVGTGKPPKLGKEQPKPLR